VALGIGDRLTGQDQCGGAIRDRLELVAAVIVPSLAKAGRRVGILSGMPLPGCFVGVDDRRPCGLTTVTATISFLEGAIGDRGLRAAQRFNCVIAILRLTRQLVFVCGILREGAHGTARFIGVFQPVEEHMVIGGVMPDARAASGAFSAGRARWSCFPCRRR
jgi:hypothetical protein